MVYRVTCERQSCININTDTLLPHGHQRFFETQCNHLASLAVRKINSGNSPHRRLSAFHQLSVFSLCLVSKEHLILVVFLSL